MLTPPAEVADLPPDPESLDATRPADLDTCERCRGLGDVTTLRGDWILCGVCLGTGERGAA